MVCKKHPHNAVGILLKNEVGTNFNIEIVLGFGSDPAHGLFDLTLSNIPSCSMFSFSSGSVDKLSPARTS
jgi:hypothetical protein